jgi:FecR protein
MTTEFGLTINHRSHTGLFKVRAGVFTGFIAAIVCLPPSCVALELSLEPAGQALIGSAPSTGMAQASGTSTLVPAVPAKSDDQTRKLCTDGTRAIDQGRWADAVKIFSEVAGQHGEHADAALYWKAYAEDKLGQLKPSQDSCKDLRTNYPKSRWIEDCGALEVEIHAKSGKPVQIDPKAGDDVKLLALNAMLRQDEPRALAEIQNILNGDSSEKLKKEAQFILGHHYSDQTFAQIVRISYVKGDVRIQRGEPSGKQIMGEWEKAVADLPIETGFSLVTGEGGSAEIEFENASTIYLDENSVLTFNDLHETAGVPFTEMALLSGTVSLNFRPYTSWEKMILHTPANDLVAGFPSKSYARVEAFTDAVSVTPLPGGELHLPGVPKEAYAPGRTFTYVEGQLQDAEGVASNEAFSAWDKWVADRVAQREAATQAVMQSAGLAEPIPGLADMAGQGRFFACAPYGTCWEPSDVEEHQDQPKQDSLRREMERPKFELAAYQPSSMQVGTSAAPSRAAQPGPAPLGSLDYFEQFPCMPSSLRYRTVKDSVSGKQTMVNPAWTPAGRRYDWAVCHAGSWIRQNHRYVWVAGNKRHHICPVRWLKSGRQVAFAPLHPYDVKGRPAINARHTVFAISGKNDAIVQSVRFERNLPIEYLKEAPKDFRTSPMAPLALAEAPRMEAHPFRDVASSKSTTGARTGIAIHFDAKSQTFLMARQEMHEGKTTTAFAPISNHSGTLQARAASFGGASGGGSRGGSSGGSRGGSGGGARGGSGSGAGGSRGGGGSSSGGGSHGGGASSGGGSGGGGGGGGSHH